MILRWQAWLRQYQPPTLIVGAATTCSSSRLVHAPIFATCPTPSCICSTPATSRWRRTPRGCINDRDVPRPDMAPTWRQPAAALTGGLIDGARSAMLNNVFSGSSDNVVRDVRQVLAEWASIRSRRAGIRFRTSCCPWKGVWNPAAQGAQL
jgi:hypothetical protein